MATKPRTVSLNGNSADIINGIAAEMTSSNPGINIPYVSNDTTSIQFVGNIIMGDSNYANSFINTLMNRIVLTVIESLFFENPLKKFKRGYLEAGDSVEEIALTLADPHAFDSTEDNQYPEQTPEDLYVAVHKLNYQAYYVKTINRVKLLAAFQTVGGMHELVESLIASMYTAAEQDEFISMKYILGWAYLNGYMGVETLDKTDVDLKNTAGIIRATGNDMELLSGDYNRYHLPTATKKKNQIYIMNTSFEAKFTTEILAYAYNMDKTEIQGQQVMINRFTMAEQNRLAKIFQTTQGFKIFSEDEIEALNNIPLFIVDERFFMIFDYLMEMTDFFNPEKLYWKYWLHTWKVLSASSFVNAMAFSYNPPVVNSITIEPTEATVMRGQTKFFNTIESIQGVGKISPYWSITGNTSSKTYITQYGKLYVGDNEKASEILLRASILKKEGEVSATATVNIE